MSLDNGQCAIVHQGLQGAMSYDKRVLYHFQNSIQMALRRRQIGFMMALQQSMNH